MVGKGLKYIFHHVYGNLRTGRNRAQLAGPFPSLIHSPQAFTHCFHPLSCQLAVAVLDRASLLPNSLTSQPDLRESKPFPFSHLGLEGLLQTNFPILLRLWRWTLWPLEPLTSSSGSNLPQHLLQHICGSFKQEKKPNQREVHIAAMPCGQHVAVWSEQE